MLCLDMKSWHYILPYLGKHHCYNLSLPPIYRYIYIIIIGDKYHRGRERNGRLERGIGREICIYYDDKFHKNKLMQKLNAA